MAARNPPTLSIDVLIPEVRNYLKGPSDPMVLSYLRIAAKQFCQDSRVWIQEIGTIQVDSTTDPEDKLIIPIPSIPAEEDGTPDLCLPPESYLNTVSKVELHDELDDDKDLALPETYNYDVVFQELIFEIGEPGLSYVTVTCVLEPSRMANCLPEFLIERHADGIRDYALYRMMTMKEREWSDPQLSVIYLYQYEARCAEAKIDRARGGTEKTIVLDNIPFN